MVDAPHAIGAAYDTAMRACGWQATLRRFAAGLSGSVLDIGCGTAYLATQVPDYVGLDRSPTMLCRAQGRVVMADGTAIPFGDDSFETVIATAVLGLLDPAERGRALRERARVARSQVQVLEPVRGVTRAPAVALSRHPLDRMEFDAAGLQVQRVGPKAYLGVYASVEAVPRRP